MTSPVSDGRGSPRARPASPARLKKRADFLAVAKGRRIHTDPFVLQGRVRPSAEATEGPRFGLTVTKKTGNAVERNRIRRRLRAVLAQAPDLGHPDSDYVIVARRELLSAPFGRLQADLARSIERLHTAKARPARDPNRQT